MAGQVRAVIAFLALASAPALAQQPQVDPNFQALLNALTQGSQVALLTPFADGTVQVTSFIAPGQRSAADAALLIERARVTLQNFGIAQPTGQQLAAALAGGVITVPTGSTQIPGVLPRGTPGVAVNSQVVSAGGLPTVIGVSPAGVAAGQAASGGSATQAPPNGTAPASPPASQQQPIITPMSPTPFLQQTR